MTFILKFELKSKKGETFKAEEHFGRSLTFLGVLQPLHKLLHLLEEHALPLGEVGLRVPLQDGLFAHDVRCVGRETAFRLRPHRLLVDRDEGTDGGGQTFVEEHHDLLEGVHEVDVVVAVLLDLQQQAELRQTLGGEGFQQCAVLLHRETKKMGPGRLRFGFCRQRRLHLCPAKPVVRGFYDGSSKLVVFSTPLMKINVLRIQAFMQSCFTLRQIWPIYINRVNGRRVAVTTAMSPKH